MQVSSSHIAAQSALAAAREAQARFQAQIRSPAPPPPGPVQNAAQPSSAGAVDGFAPLPLKQAAQPQATAAPAGPRGQPPARMGQHVDITV
jgi:hypothetical protein